MGDMERDGMDVFPAPAGMNRRAIAAMDCRHCVPRACGDEPDLTSVAMAIIGCSPRLRG
uniref:Uncharacterized protein n=1 Tax=mine drainage metagenome TaxID=410659 RepID=E6QU49_9ZZZZ